MKPTIKRKIFITYYCLRNAVTQAGEPILIPLIPEEDIVQCGTN
jgi:hypothetical protein